MQRVARCINESLTKSALNAPTGAALSPSSAVGRLSAPNADRRRASWRLQVVLCGQRERCCLDTTTLLIVLIALIIVGGWRLGMGRQRRSDQPNLVSGLRGGFQRKTCCPDPTRLPPAVIRAGRLGRPHGFRLARSLTPSHNANRSANRGSAVYAINIHSNRQTRARELCDLINCRRSRPASQPFRSLFSPH